MIGKINKVQPFPNRNQFYDIDWNKKLSATETTIDSVIAILVLK